MSLASRIVCGLVLGLVLGLVVSSLEAQWALSLPRYIEPVGVIWVNGIRMTVVPLVIALLITAVAGEQDGRTVASIGGKTLALFGAMIGAVCLFTALFAPIFLSWANWDPSLIASFSAGDVGEVVLPPFRDWFVGLIPTNPFRAAVEGSMLPLVVFTVLFAFAITKVADELRQTLVRLFMGIKEAMFVLIGWVMFLAPVGVFALIFTLTVQLGASFVGAMIYFLIIACGMVLIATLALYPVAIMAGKLSLTKFVRACAPAQVIGFTSRSSLASLPAMFAATNKLALSPQVSGLVLPVAVSIFKFASPIARGTGTYFVAALYGIELGPAEIAIIAAAIGLLSFYSPGIPSGGLLIMTPIYTMLGLPVEGIGLLIALDLGVDMFITLGNVTANITVTALMTRQDR